MGILIAYIAKVYLEKTIDQSKMRNMGFMNNKIFFLSERIEL